MSHFTVLVTGEDIDVALAPFIEQQEEGYEQYFTLSQECTHEEMIKDFKENGEGYDSVEQFAEKYHGYHREGDSWGYYRNPNAKWDWYSLGGRWTGLLKLKEGTQGDTGSPGLMTAPAEEGYADSALKRDIDWDGMRAEEKAKGLEYARKIFSALLGKPMHVLWDEIRDVKHKDNIDVAREVYRAQESVKAVNSLEGWHDLETLLDVCGSYNQFKDQPVFTQKHIDVLIEEYANYRAISAGQTFAVLHDGVWSERGEMGWFGVAHNEKDKLDWTKAMGEFIDSLPDDTRINIVDCHI
jgi:hypothetical protein